LIDLLPPFLRDNKEYIAIFNYAAQMELEEAEVEYNTLLNNQFVLTSDSNTIRRWEKMMGIQPDYAMTLEMRRERVFFSLNTYVPYTYRLVLALLEQLYPVGTYELSLDVPQYSITILTRLGVQDISPVLLEQLARIIPLNMIYSMGILYNEYEDLEPLTYAQLENFTYLDLEETYLPPNIPPY